MIETEKAVIGEIDRIQARLVKLVHWFNSRGELESGTKAQLALVAVNDIFSGDGDYETAYDPPASGATMTGERE